MSNIGEEPRRTADSDGEDAGIMNRPAIAGEAAAAPDAPAGGPASAGVAAGAGVAAAAMPYSDWLASLGMAVAFCTVALLVYQIVGLPFEMVNNYTHFFAGFDHRITSMVTYDRTSFSLAKLAAAASSYGLFLLCSVATVTTAIALLAIRMRGAVAKVVAVGAVIAGVVAVAVFDLRPRLGLSVYRELSKHLYHGLLIGLPPFEIPLFSRLFGTTHLQTAAPSFFNAATRIHFAALFAAVAAIGGLAAGPLLRLVQGRKIERRFAFPADARLLLVLASAVTSTYILITAVFQELYKTFALKEGIDRQEKINIINDLEYMSAAQSLQIATLFITPVIVVSLFVILLCESAIKLYPPTQIERRKIIQSAIYPIYISIAIKAVILVLENY